MSLQIYNSETVLRKDQISKKTPTPKCRLFLKIDQKRYLVAGEYLPEGPHTSLWPNITWNNNNTWFKYLEKLGITWIAPFF